MTEVNIFSSNAVRPNTRVHFEKRQQTITINTFKMFSLYNNEALAGEPLTSILQ